MYRWIIALSFVAISAHAQAGTIDPGMTRAQVIERLGKPATVRNYQGSTYLMYSNNCGKKCGMQDIVILDHDVVVDALFRSPNRHYTGTSTSPEATKPNSRSQHNKSLTVPAGTTTNNATTSTTPVPATPSVTNTVPQPAAPSASTEIPTPAPPSVSTEVPRPAPATTTTTPVNPQKPPASPIPHKGAIPAKADSALVPFQGSKMSPEDSAMHSTPPNTPPAVNTTTPPRA